MEARKVWMKIKRNKIPHGRRCVKHKWVWKVKRNGVFRARLVACGYSQIPGVDYTENFAPVVNDITYRIMLIGSIVWGLKNIIIDVETAFLHGELEEEIFMDCPEGFDHEKDECLRLNKTIYGLVQSARQFFKILVKALRDIGFKGGYADPCLLTRKCKLGIVFIALYVDDCYCCGTEAAIKDTIEKIQQKGFTVKIEYEMTDYLSCELRFSADRKRAWLGQPHLIKNLERKFGELMNKTHDYSTPGTPNQGIVRPIENEVEITKEQHKMYRSGVGMLLYLVKHSRPDIANAMRELSKVLDKPTPAAMKELLRVVKFVLSTRNYGLKIEPRIMNDQNDQWDLVAYTDSDWAGDKDTRISVSDYAIFLLGVPVSWKSKGQRSVTLSSSEAELVALSEAAKEIKFIVQILLSMGIPVKLPVICRVDNVGAIFMAENTSTSQRTKHIDLRHRFITEFIEDGFIKIIFVKTKENLSDWFTKNVSSDIYEGHKHAYIKEKNFVETSQYQ